MVRRSAIGLAGFLFLLWLLALTQNATTWLTWSVGASVMLALGVAKLVPNDAGPQRAALWPALLGAVLAGVAALGFAAGATRWLRWWTAIVAVAFLGLAAAAPGLPWLRAQRN